MDIKPLTAAPISGKRVLMRVDFNTEVIQPGEFDDFRMKTALRSVRWVLKQKPKYLLLVSHLGSPKGKPVKSLSLKPFAKYFSKLLKKEVSFISDFEKFSPNSTPKSHAYPAYRTGRRQAGKIALLENIRFHPGEEANDQKFAKKIAALGDVFINEAFSASHRKHASITLIPKFLPSYAGFQLLDEIKNLNKLLEHIQKPFVVLLGGAKISTKLPVIKKFLILADYIFVGGGIANTLLQAAGYSVGKSISEKDLISLIVQEKLLDSKKLKVPYDFLTGLSYESKMAKYKLISEVDKSDLLLDIGKRAASEFIREIRSAKTILWNGPFGYFENPVFEQSTKAVIKTISENKSVFSVAGGGETIAAIRKYRGEKGFSFISTGGGAMLEYLAGEKLPGIEALKR